MTDRMQLVEQHIIRRDDKRFAVLDRACFHAKNLYNAANYELRQTLFAEHRRMTSAPSRAKMGGCNCGQYRIARGLYRPANGQCEAAMRFI